MRVVGIKSRSSERVPSAINHWAISVVPQSSPLGQDHQLCLLSEVQGRLGGAWDQLSNVYNYACMRQSHSPRGLTSREPIRKLMRTEPDSLPCGCHLTSDHQKPFFHDLKKIKERIAVSKTFKDTKQGLRFQSAALYCEQRK